jgi:hypothetical protein
VGIARGRPGRVGTAGSGGLCPCTGPSASAWSQAAGQTDWLGTPGIRTPGTLRCSSSAARRLDLTRPPLRFGAPGRSRTCSARRRAGYSRLSSPSGPTHVVPPARVERALSRVWAGSLCQRGVRRHGARRGTRTPTGQPLELVPLPLGYPSMMVGGAGIEPAESPGSEPGAFTCLTTRRRLSTCAAGWLAEERGVEPPTLRSPRFSRPVAHHRAAPSASDDARGTSY